MFITTTEWNRDYGGKKEAKSNVAHPLPFDCCAMSLSPFETAVCTKEGVVFDILNVMPFIKQHKTNPLTGEPMSSKELIRLTWHKNTDGKWHCPITFKVFNSNSRICAIRTTGNVYSMEAVEELNLKTKSFQDLLTDEPFSKKDIIKLNDPGDAELCARRDVGNFIHMKTLRDEETKRAEAASHTSKITQNLTTQQIFKEIEEKRRTDAEERETAQRAQQEADEKAEIEAIRTGAPIWKRKKILYDDLVDGVKQTTNVMAGSFTSTAAEIVSVSAARFASDEEVTAARHKRLRALKKKAYVQLQTSHGNLNVEIRTDMVPRTAENFIGLCAKGYYDGTKFHRNIPGFMIQGGDPTGTGKGGECLWGGKMRDEHNERLNHDKRGILSMANSGPHTVGSQFFVTYGECRHLDKKHSVFGHVVGGMATLANMECVSIGKNDVPERDITLIKAVVLQNPIDEMEAAFAEELTRKANERKEREQKASSVTAPSDNVGTRIGWASNPTPELPGGAGSNAVGRFIGKNTVLPLLEKDDKQASSGKRSAASITDSTLTGAEPDKKKAASGSYSFGNFSGW